MIKIIVYGIGKRGMDFIQYVHELSLDIKIIAVSDTYKHSWDVETNSNIPYIEASHISQSIYDYVVVTPNDHYETIKRRLLELHVDKEKIMTIKDMYKKYGNFFGNKSESADLFCNLCGSNISAWRYIGSQYTIFHSNKIVGGSKRRGGCPICGGSDRERYVYYILKHYTNIMDGLEHSVLHFAPEEFLSQTLKKLCGRKYISADIVPGRAETIANIEKLQFESGVFEYIICNHVMEHIYKEQEAFYEIKRCLIRGGILILTVPICWEHKTFEDDTIKTEEERIKWYGQKDHVRLYGNDIVERVEHFGFDVTSLRCNEMVDEFDIKRMGFIPEDVVLFCKKFD